MSLQAAAVTREALGAQSRGTRRPRVPTATGYRFSWLTTDGRLTGLLPVASLFPRIPKPLCQLSVMPCSAAEPGRTEARGGMSQGKGHGTTNSDSSMA